MCNRPALKVIQTSQIAQCKHRLVAHPKSYTIHKHRGLRWSLDIRAVVTLQCNMINLSVVAGGRAVGSHRITNKTIDRWNRKSNVTTIWQRHVWNEAILWCYTRISLCLFAGSGRCNCLLIIMVNIVIEFGLVSIFWIDMKWLWFRWKLIYSQ